jgi:hypothetical protein
MATAIAVAAVFVLFLFPEKFAYQKENGDR